MGIANGKQKNEVNQFAETLNTSVFPNNNEFSSSETMGESIEEEAKNPMLLSPVLRCVLQFLNVKDIKNCRLVCREWGSTGKLALANRAVVNFCPKSLWESARRPVHYYSCFPDSSAIFTSFRFSSIFTQGRSDDPWTIKELTQFFEEQKKYIKELTLEFDFLNEEIAKKINISSWISKSPMVQKDAKFMTKLSIEGYREELHIPLHLIAHIKDLTLKDCRINLETGIKICPIKLQLAKVAFFQSGIKLDRVRINDIVDFRKAKEISLYCTDYNTRLGCIAYYIDTEIFFDFWGSVTVDKVILKGCEIENGETSEWVINHLETIHVLQKYIPYFLNSQLKIKELFLYQWSSCAIDLFTLPNSIEKLALGFELWRNTIISCSQPLMLNSLQYLLIFGGSRDTDYSFLSHFSNCRQLTHLKFHLCNDLEKKSFSMLKNIKTLTFEYSSINFVDDNYYWNLEKLVFDHCINVLKLCKSRIRVDDLVMNCKEVRLDNLVDLLKCPKLFKICKRIYVGELDRIWSEKKLEERFLKESVDFMSSFYVFQKGQKGRAISQKMLYELIPKHIDLGHHTCGVFH